MKRIPKLDLRLDAIYKMITGVDSIADIGCDHGRLSLHLAKQGLKVISTDISMPSLKKAKRLAELHDVKIDIRYGYGLDIIKPFEVKAFILAGMGQNTIKKILCKGKRIVDCARYIICQSMNGDYDLRLYLSENYFNIIDETLALKGHRLYCIIKAEPNSPRKLNEIEKYCGPVLLKNKSRYFDRYLGNNIRIIENIISGMKTADKPDYKKIMYLQEIENKIKDIRNA